MFAPLKTWRRWHRKVNLNQRRYALCSALAASAVVPLIMARGHKVDNIPCIPLVVNDNFVNVEKTSLVLDFLKRFGFGDDLDRVKKGRVLRAGKGKARGRRYRHKKGALLVLADTNVKLAKAARNIPGVDVANVNALDIRQLAPGASLGRLIIWTKGAFQELRKLFGSTGKPSQYLSSFQLQRSCLSNADIQRIINSNEVQSVVRAAKSPSSFSTRQNRNPFRNSKAMERLTPGFTACRNKKRATISKRTKELQGFKAKGKGKKGWRNLKPAQRKARNAQRKASK